MNKIEQAVLFLGGQAAASRALRVTPQAVAFWLAGERQPSAETAIDIERATGGLVRVEEIRPDIDWAVLRNPAPAQPT